MGKWLEWAQRIGALAQTGLFFVKDPFDKERYEQIRELAGNIIAEYSESDPEIIHTLLAEETGYITPKIDVRGAVFRDGQILLVKEKSDGLWTLPGGWADVGDSPSQAVEREIVEESGYTAKAIKLMALYDRKQHHPYHIYEIYKIFFLCELTGGTATQSIETSEIAWFGEDALPDLSTGRVTAVQVRRWFEHYRNPALPTEFD